MQLLKVALVLHMIGAVMMLQNKEAFSTIGEEEQLIAFDPIEEFETFEHEYLQDTTGITSVTDSTIG